MRPATATWRSRLCHGLVAVLAAAGLGLPAGPAGASASPGDVVAATAAEVSRQLDGRRDYLEAHPDELYAMVDQVLLPSFDRRYAGFLALGPHWRTASAAQRDRFVAAFFAFLVRTYARGLLDFEPASLELLPELPPTDGGRTRVDTRMRQDDGTLVPVTYSLRETASGWKVYDVRVEGVSYIQNYRNQFNAEIAARGLDALIQRLETETAPSSGSE